MAVTLSLDNENLAKAYDEVSDSQFNNGRVLIEKLEIKPGDSVLDVGSGTGRLGRYVSAILGGAGSYVGIDPLEERIKIANEKNQHPNAVFQIGNAEDLRAIVDNSIDVVYLNAVFHWVLNKEVALAEIFRILKPEGKVGITTAAKELKSVAKVRVITDRVLQRAPYDKLVRLEDSTQNQHGLTTTELIALLTQAGFKIKEVQIKEITRKYQTAKDVIRFSEASSFGNYLNHVPDSLREQAKSDIEAELEKHRTEDGVQFNGYTIFAVATKDDLNS
jgi:ubiquinone/menaquinone biosynthesis C-methylase UbiE